MGDHHNTIIMSTRELTDGIQSLAREFNYLDLALAEKRVPEGCIKTTSDRLVEINQAIKQLSEGLDKHLVAELLEG